MLDFGEGENPGRSSVLTVVGVVDRAVMIY